MTIRIFKEGTQFVLQDNGDLTKQVEFNSNLTRYSHKNGRHSFEYQGGSVEYNFSDIRDKTGGAYASEAIFIAAMRAKTEISMPVINGSLINRLVSAATTNSTLVKSTAGKLLGFALTNTSAGALYVKYYDKATAPTVGTDTPILTIIVPPGDTKLFNSGEKGIAFSNGLGFAITGGAPDANVTAVVAGDIIAQTFYE